ncbi:poly-gamma-glutamate synthase PgsB [Micromonospora sp. SCSIO 07396]
MLFLYLVFLLACLGLLAGGIIEQRNHHRSLHRIPQRVLVNGIRGKSSITRLTAGALRGGRLVVVAKTTGTAARFIFPDASEEPVYRKFGIANVVEQIGIVRRAAAYYPDALVIECMAVMPPLQELNQTKLIQSTIGILCNVREDHLAEMGPTLDDVARSLSRSMPVGGICVTAESDRLHILQAEADKRSCKLIPVDPESVTDDEMAGFTWTTFKENVAIALKVAELLGVSRQAALTGMWTAPPDPGVLSVEEYRRGDTSLRFANIFAANDPESTFMNIKQLQEQGSIPRPLHVLINCRPDRVERNGQMGALVSRIDPDRVILIGEPTRSARLKIEEKWQDRVVDLGGRIGAGELLDGVLGSIDGFASVLAIGNIHGQGEILLAQLGRLDRPVSQDPPARAVPPAPPAHAVPPAPAVRAVPPAPAVRAVPPAPPARSVPAGPPARPVGGATVGRNGVPAGPGPASGGSRRQATTYGDPPVPAAPPAAWPGTPTPRPRPYDGPERPGVPAPGRPDRYAALAPEQLDRYAALAPEQLDRYHAGSPGQPDLFGPAEQEPPARRGRAVGGLPERAPVEPDPHRGRIRRSPADGTAPTHPDPDPQSSHRRPSVYRSSS